MTFSPQTIIVTIGHTTNAVICAALLLLVLWQAPRLRSNQLFALMMLCLSIFSLLNVFGRFLQPLEIEPKPVYLITNCFYIGYVALLFLFAADFARLKSRQANAVRLLAIVANVLFALTQFSDQAFGDVYPLPDGSGGFNYVTGPLFWPMIGTHLAYLVIILVVLYNSKERRARLMWPAVAFVLGGFVALAIRPIVPLPLNALFLAASALWMGYVVLNHQLFNPLAELNRELAATNVELEKANRLKSQFLANMSHELRTPLNSIIGYTELVLNGLYGELNDKQHDRLDRVVRNARHLLGLINDILDLSKIEAGRMLLNIEDINTGEVLESVLATIEPLANEKSLAIVRDFADAPQIQADETRTRQIFVNLLSNAVKFTREGGITVHADNHAVDGMTRFYVRDTGIGIPEDKLDLVFEEFRQIDGSSTRKYQGTGLGLAITRRLVEMHGGRLWLESEVDVGTTFYLTFPAAETKPLPKTAPLKPKQPVILVIDDDPAALAMLSDYLSSNGYNIVSAGSGPEGLARARDLHPDLIMLDAMMPGMTGWQALKTLKSDPITARIPVIMIGMADKSPHAISLGASDVVVKPISEVSVLDSVRQALAEQKDATILVVDDNEADRTLLESILTSAGHEVVTVDGGQAAIDWLVENQASLVLLDLMMPNVTGFDVLRFIRDNQALSDIPVLVVSAKDLTPEEERVLSRRYADLIQKGGLVQELLLAEVKESLKHHE